jgi:opacity protein-like surface antigen
VRRIKAILTVFAVMVVVVVAAAPAAMAANNHNNNQNNKQHSGNNGSAFFVVNDDNDFDHNDFDHNDFGNVFFDNGFDQDIDETGDVRLDTSIVNTGNNSNQCAAPLQFGNTGNFQNARFFNQIDSFADDIDFDGGSFEFLPEQALECGQGVFQSAASG